MFRRVLEREAEWLPPWHALLRVYRRLEAQGRIRGGRFVAGMSGRAVRAARGGHRAARRPPPRSARAISLSLSAADPLNLTGIVTPGARVPALAGNRVLFRDGVPGRDRMPAGQSDFLVPMEPADEWAARQVLLRKRLLPWHARARAV